MNLEELASRCGERLRGSGPESDIVISSRISQRLDELKVTQGDVVKSGAVIARLYNGELQDKLRKAQARAREREEQVRLARANYERALKVDEGVLSERDIDHDKTAYATAKEAHSAALAELALAAKELSFCTVEVPTDLPDLRVLDIHHKPGDWIALDKSAAIVSLYDPKKIQVRIDVPQSKIRFVKQGQRVKIRTEANPDREYAATVARVEPLATLSKNTITVRITVNDPDELLFPEMVAHATFMRDEQVSK